MSRSAPHRIASSFALVAALSFPGAALADGAVGVAEFTGSSKKAVRARVVAALKKAGVEVAGGAPIADAGDDGAAYAKVAKKRKLTAVVTGHVSLQGKRWKVALVVRSAESGEPRGGSAADAAWLPGLMKAIDKKVAAELSAALAEPEPEEADRAAAGGAVELDEEPEQNPEPVVRDEPEREPGSDDPRKDDGAKRVDPAGAGAPRALALSAELRVFRRSFDYEGDFNHNLRRYDLGGAPSARIRGSWYPGAHATRGAAANVGVAASYEHGLATDSRKKVGGSGELQTTLQAFAVGVRGRLPIGLHEVGLGFDYGGHSFDIGGDEDTRAISAGGTAVERDLLPDVSYRYVRPSLFAELHFGKVGFGAELGYRHLVGLGDLGGRTWFPRATGSAFDVGLFGSYEVGSHLALVAGGDLVLYHAVLDTKATDLALGRDLASGADDRYLSGFVGVALTLPGEG